MRNDLDHLPANKQRELERVVQIIFEEFADSVALATMSWKKKGRIDKIILYGSYARGGWVEEAVMRLADFTFAFPALLTAIMLTAIYGPGLVMSIVAIGIFNIPVFARITRGAANAVWSREYVLAARAAGKGGWRITIDHVLPNIASQLIVQASISFATAILAEAALSYLGLGTQPPQPSWGRMLSEAQTLLFQAPLLAVWPGVAIVLSVLGLNLMGDGLRDLLDPKLARQR